MNRVRLAAATTVAVLAMTDAAPADPVIQASVTPGVLSSPDTRSLSYGLQFTTGPEAERLHVSFVADSAFPGGLELIFLTPGTARLDGPGSLYPGPGGHADVVGCSNSLLPQWHGIIPSFGEVDLELPPDSASTFVLPAEVAGSAPFPGMRARVRFRLSNQTFGGRAGTLDRDYALDSPAPTLAGRRGVRIRLSTRPRALPGCRRPPRIRAGRRVTLFGRADPAIAGHELRLRYVPPGRRAAIRIADVRVRADGSFVHRGWRPRRRGLHEVAAGYRSQTPELADDFSVPVRLDVVRASATSSYTAETPSASAGQE